MGICTNALTFMSRHWQIDGKMIEVGSFGLKYFIVSVKK